MTGYLSLFVSAKSGIAEGVRLLVQGLALLFLTVAAYAWSLLSLWTIDDYFQVYGIYGNPMRTFVEGLSRTDQGTITPHRLLMYWLIGSGGIVGPMYAHFFALIIHLLTTFFFGGLVWRLFRSRMLAFLASGWFAVAPWVTQPVLWWSAVSTTIATTCQLMAAHFFLNSFAASTHVRSVWWLVLACLTVFVGLCFYDLWAAGFLLFVGIGIVLFFEDEFREGVSLRGLIARTGVMAVPFILWVGLIAIVGVGVDQPSASFERLALFLGLTHLSLVDWVRGPDWLDLWRIGIDALRNPVAGFSFTLGLALLVLIFANFVMRKSAPQDPKYIGNSGMAALPSNHFPWVALAFAWMMFLACRLVLIFPGQVLSQSRVNYGAGMAIAFAAAALARWAWYRLCSRSLVASRLAFAATVVSIVLMTLATAARARHMALVSQAEAYTIDFLDGISSAHPEIRSVTLVGLPVADVGELNYFEDEGIPTVLLRKLGHDMRVRILRSSQLHSNDPASDSYFRWSGHWPGGKLAAFSRP